MKKLLLLLPAVLFFFTGCKKDDSTTVTPPAETDPIVNTWVSEGADVAPGLKATLKTKKIVATFNANKTYTVIATDSTGGQVTYTGTFVTSTNTGSTIRSIVLTQTSPTAVTSTGIYKVDSTGGMKYEVVQTTPAITGFEAPTATGGFGSTKYNGTPLGTTWVQGFVLQNPASDPIVGTWTSEGTNVAPGLRATLKTKKIVATFNANKTYTVVATDSSNASVTYTGTFTATANSSTTIRTIVLQQATPTAVTSTGIYQVSGIGLLTYEVIQTTPAITGFTAPTYDLGFGSTKYSGVPLGATWVQKFTK